MSKTISLHRGRDAWYATSRVNGQPDPEQVDLFGTATLPTCFTAEAKALDVLSAIQRLNLGAQVTINSNAAA